MKSKLLLCVIIGLFLVVSVSGCTPNAQKEYQLISISVNEELGFAELHHDGVIYRPYGITPRELRGEQIGIREDTDNGIVCEVKGYEQAEWLIDYLDVFMGGGDTLWKAVGVTDIPSELEQHKEYDY